MVPKYCCAFNAFGFIEYFIIGVYLRLSVVYHSRMDKKHLYVVPEPSDQEKEQYALSLVQAGTDAFMSDDPVVRKKGLAEVEKILNPPKPSLTVIPSKK